MKAMGGSFGFYSRAAVLVLSFAKSGGSFGTHSQRHALD